MDVVPEVPGVQAALVADDMTNIGDTDHTIWILPRSEVNRAAATFDSKGLILLVPLAVFSLTDRVEYRDRGLIEDLIGWAGDDEVIVFGVVLEHNDQQPDYSRNALSPLDAGSRHSEFLFADDQRVLLLTVRFEGHGLTHLPSLRILW